MAKKKPEVVIYKAIASGEPKAMLIKEAEVHAGFPCPVDDAYKAQPIDLNEVLVKNPPSTYILKVKGDSMIEEGIDEGDLLVVDRSQFPTETSIAVVILDGEFALKRIVQREGQVLLYSGNKNYPPIPVQNPEDLRVWGVVRWVLKKK